jgi:hypothetical protein
MMLGDMVTIKTPLFGAFDQLQTLLVDLGQRKLIAIDPIEDAELDRSIP